MRTLLVLVALAIALGALLVRQSARPFPSDHTPEGAYMRVALAVEEDRLRDVFPYLETEAEWAAFGIREAREKAFERVKRSYPEAEAAPLLKAYGPVAGASDGPDSFAVLARQKGWTARLRRDLSGVAHVDVEGERATVTTARGTRYPFRRRENGIWGLTIFTANLAAERERASRDLAVVTAAADDYDRARTSESPPGPGRPPSTAGP